MEKQKVDQFMMVNGKNFPAMMHMQIRQKLESLDESQSGMLMSMEWKSPLTCFLLDFFLGYLGIDRFYLGQTGQGIGKLLTCGGCGIWSLINLFTSHEDTRKCNYNKLMMSF